MNDAATSCATVPLPTTIHLEDFKAKLQDGQESLVAGGHTFVLDDEFRNVLGSLDTDADRHLEASLLEHGCRDPVVRWKQTQILVDGHNRARLAQKHGLPLRVVDLEFDDRDAARRWSIQNQMGRRNLTPDQARYLRGALYNSQKKAHGGRRPSGQSDHLKTAERLAADHGVSPKTMRRDGEYAAAIDRLSATCGADSKSRLLGKRAPLKDKDLFAVVQLPKNEQPAALAQRLDPPPKARRPKEIILSPPSSEVRVVVLRGEEDVVTHAQKILGFGTSRAAELCRVLHQALHQLDPRLSQEVARSMLSLLGPLTELEDDEDDSARVGEDRAELAA